MYDKSGKLIDRRELLKVKFNSLMVEAHIIRAAERKQKAYGKRAALPMPWLLFELRDHRVMSLRKEARLTHLALGFIKGRTLKQMEGTTRHPLTKADTARIEAMLRKYGPTGMVMPGTEPAPAKAEAVAA